MQNFMILSPALSDTALITSDTEVQGLGALNLQNQFPDLPLRTQSTEAVLLVDFGQATEINAVVLGYGNFTPTATWRITLGNDPATLDTSPAIDHVERLMLVDPDQANWPFNHCVEMLQPFTFQPIPTYRYVRIHIKDLNNPSGYLQAARAMLGQAILPGVNIDFGWRLRHREVNNKTRSPAGTVFANALGKWRELRVTLSGLTEDEAYGDYYDLDHHRGTSRDFYICRDIDNYKYRHKQSFIGTNKDMDDIVHPNQKDYSKQLVLEEYI